jgi:hypothetical protein
VFVVDKRVAVRYVFIYQLFYGLLWHRLTLSQSVTKIYWVIARPRGGR